MSIKYFYQNKEIFITEETKTITPHTWFKNGKIFDEYLIDFFYDECKKVDKPVIIDIGAQTGSFTLLAKYLPESKFYSFEPYEPCYKCLNENIILNKINNVETYLMGISDKKGVMKLKIPDHKGLCSFSNKPLRFNKYIEKDVEVNTLDNLFL
jgi:FkbM family methyltransferase